MKRLVSATLLGIVVASLTSPTARAGTEAERSVVAAIPGSRAGSYATPVVAVRPGDELTFVNADPFVHDVRSVEMGPDNTSWCKPFEAGEPAHPRRNPRQFPKGKCPLLWSLGISMTVGVVETKVYGTENLESGSTVEFYCTVWPDMRGEVVVL
jgi:plastocyanin